MARELKDGEEIDARGICGRALEFARVGFFRYRFDGTVQSMDRGTLELLDLAATHTPEDVVGKQIGELLIYTGPPGRLRQILRERREVRGLEYPYRTLSGKDRCVLHNSFVITDSATGEEEIQVICMDATELRDAKARLEALNAELEGRVARRTAELEAANAELRSFAYTVSHDLRAPLRAIDGFSYALFEEFAEVLGSTGRGYLERVRNGCQTMASLIDGLLRLSRVSRHQLAYEKVDLGAVGRSVMARLCGECPGRELRFEAAPDMVVEGDPALIEVLLENLLGNAWKFTARKSPARIRLGATENGGRQVFFVSDDGVGFDRRYRGKLFRNFERLHPVEEYAGSGIGLATVKRIVERHGGHVWADGAEGEGATFFFTLEP